MFATLSQLSFAKKTLLGLSLLGVFLATVAFTFAYSIYSDVYVETGVVATPVPVVVPDEVQSDPEPEEQKPLAVLLLGYGGAGHAGGGLTDSMIVAHIDPRFKRVTLISIPRDLWVQIPISEDTTIESKINAAYAIGRDDRKYPNKQERYTGEGGAGTLTKDIVSQVTGIPIDYFVSVDFSGFTDGVDAFGGLDIEVPYTFDDPFYPIKGKEADPCGRSEDDIAALTATMSGTKLEYAFECRFELLHFDKGMTHMDGQTALKFVRSRHSNVNGNDFGRSLRQQALILAARKKLFALGSVPKMITQATSLSKYVQTDVPISELSSLYDRFPDIDTYQVRSLLLTNDNVFMNARSADNQFILAPKSGIFDWQLLQMYIAGYLESE